MYMNISQAFKEAMAGNGVSREGWNGKGLVVRVQYPDENSKMSVPYMYIDATALGGKVQPWMPSQTDTFATDWRVVEEVEKKPEQ